MPVRRTLLHRRKRRNDVCTCSRTTEGLRVQLGGGARETTRWIVLTQRILLNLPGRSRTMLPYLPDEHSVVWTVQMHKPTRTLIRTVDGRQKVAIVRRMVRNIGDMIIITMIIIFGSICNAQMSSNVTVLEWAQILEATSAPLRHRKFCRKTIRPFLHCLFPVVVQDRFFTRFSET